MKYMEQCIQATARRRPIQSQHTVSGPAFYEATLETLLRPENSLAGGVIEHGFEYGRS
jgi:hypothetical protein